MCLYPKLVRNPRYKINKKNGGNIPYMRDPRVGFVPIGCTYCIECMKQKANNWKVRLLEDIKEYKNGKFITLTFSNENYTELSKNFQSTGYLLDNQIATLAVRRFLERWRKKTTKSIRHWLITELGQTRTEHLHLHGILYTDNLDEVEKKWKYGYIWKGRPKNGQYMNYVNESTISYITKYVTKTDMLHKYYKPKILCSPGIGARYIKTYNAKLNKFKGTETKTTYTARNGFEYNLPIYYRNKIYTEDEREQLWLMQLDKNIRYVCGEKVAADDEKNYQKLLAYHRRENTKMGYGAPDNWKAIEYEIQRRALKQAERLAKQN